MSIEEIELAKSFYENQSKKIQALESTIRELSGLVMHRETYTRSDSLQKIDGLVELMKVICAQMYIPQNQSSQ